MHSDDSLSPLLFRVSDSLAMYALCLRDEIQSLLAAEAELRACIDAQVPPPSDASGHFDFAALDTRLRQVAQGIDLSHRQLAQALDRMDRPAA